MKTLLIALFVMTAPLASAYATANAQTVIGYGTARSDVQSKQNAQEQAKEDATQDAEKQCHSKVEAVTDFEFSEYCYHVWGYCGVFAQATFKCLDASAEQ